LEFVVFGAKAVGGNFKGYGRDADEEGIGVHPPGEPGFEMRLAAKFVDEGAVVIENKAVADYMRRAAGGVEFSGNLRVQNPELAFESGGGVHGERRATGDLGNELNVVAGFFQ